MSVPTIISDEPLDNKDFLVTIGERAFPHFFVATNF